MVSEELSMQSGENSKQEPIHQYLPDHRTERDEESDGRAEQAEPGYGPLLDCCSQTITMHAANNPMMVCQECKQLIKCFKDEKAFKNYITFCKSRGRKLLVASHDPYKIVVFNSYEPYR